MKTGKRWSSWKLTFWPLLALPIFVCAPGCVKNHAMIEKNLLAHHVERNEGVPQTYRVACPDVIGLVSNERPEFTGRHTIGADGRIDLGEYGKLRIEGRTLPEIARLLAEETGVNPVNVQIQVSEFRSQHVLLFGEVRGLQRRVPYRGPETVIDLLHRVGGITTGAAPDDVYVVRPHVGDNQRPEVFHVDLGAIVMKQDQRTNLRVQPFDQIYVGETRRSKVEKAIPPLLLGVFHLVWPADRGQGAGVRSQESGTKKD